MSSSQYYKVGVLLFPGADILDFAGPMEVLSHVSLNRNPDEPDRMFTLETIAQGPTIRAAGGSCLTVQADTLLEQALQNIHEYDILVVPGGAPSVVQPLVNGNGPEIDFIRRFAALSLPPSQRPRILFSVCTGAHLVGAAGVLGGMTVTTHHRAVDTLREICDRFNKTGSSTVVHKRYIDGGLLKGDAVQLLTAGGVSSGLDASLFLVRQLTSSDMGAFVSRVMEYDWTEQNK
jgi:transcriptional regulator GlxA family with amidase domain